MDDGARGDERIGELIADRYRLTRLLGSGGMGAVYESVHEFTQRRVAVKLMHPSFARSRQAAERFVREAQAPSSIGHPGIVEVLDGGRADDGTLYLVLELLQGQTLGEAMKQGPLAPGELSAIALGLLGALGAAHDAGFVHRDIKPDNVFLLPDDEGGVRVKLLDFGVTAVLSADSPALTQAGAVLGTPLYMSPEQALGRRVDGRSDLWSVGAVCYQALTGKPPFSGASVQALIVSISTQGHLPLSVASPGLSLRVVKVVERALHKQPDKRWQSAAEMADALRGALGPAPAQPALLSAAEASALRAASAGASAQRSVRDPRYPPADAAQGTALRRVLLPAGFGIALLATLAFSWARPGSSARDAQAASRMEARVRDGAPLAPRPPAATSESPSGETRGEPAPRAAEADALRAAAAEQGAPGGARANAAQEPNGANGEPPSAAGALAARTHDGAEPPTLGLDETALSRVLHAHDAELQRCYEDAVVAQLMQPAAGQPAVEPRPMRLDAALAVAASGEVERAAIEGAAPESLRACLQSAMRAFRFPRAGAATDVRFPIVLQPSVMR